MRRNRRDAVWNPPSSGNDIGPLFALLVAVPMVLPAILDAGDLAFALPLAVLPLAAYRASLAAARRTERRTIWLVVAAGCAFGAAGSALAVATAFGGVHPLVGFYVGAGGSACLIAGTAVAAARTLRHARLERLLDALLLCILIAAYAIWFVVVPGFRQGDSVLTAIFVVDVGAVVLAVLATIALRGRLHRRVGWGLTALCGSVALGDALIAMQAAGTLSPAPLVIAALWAGGGVAALHAAGVELHASGVDREPGERLVSPRWVYARVALPLLALLALLAVPVALHLQEALSAGGTLYFGGFFLLMLVLAFARQAYLLVDNGRAISRERGLHAEVIRRNAELEALTGLATTMTQTLEEEPIVERGVDVLRLAARASSGALHVPAHGGVALRAAIGDWPAEGIWAGAPALEPAVHTSIRGGRAIVHLPLSAHGDVLGVVTLVRPAKLPFGDDELELLRLLSDQLAIALRNADAYRERLEQAIRDPLTGLHNRRHFYEVLEKEVGRALRYERPMSLVLFDVDDFKGINDSLGHTAGDETLRALAGFVQERVRPSDTFARVGGEEFGLVLPETDSLQALLIAERLRRALADERFLDDRRVTVSGGVASCPHDGETLELIEQKADRALYWSKQNGKNICAVASEVVVLDAEDGTGEESPMVAHLHALVTTLDAAHLKTRDHSENVAAYAVAIGHSLGFDSEHIVKLHRAALLHDIGKLAVRAEVLTKPGALSDDEYAEIKTHSTVGASMLLHSGLGEEARWVRHHHERMDGRGYPDGLAGHEIPLEARIIFVADSFEAMTSDRPYRAGLDAAQAMDELRRCARSQFDADIVSVLSHLVEQGELTVLALRDPAQ